MGRASIEYINKDYESIRQELLAKVPQLTDRWTDFNHSDLGVVLLELFCGVGDMLAYYLDAQAAEAFLPTARQRQNVINLCNLIGYQLDTPVSSTTTIRFSLAAPLDFDLPIPAGTQCRALLEDGKATLKPWMMPSFPVVNSPSIFTPVRVSVNPRSWKRPESRGSGFI